MRARSLGFTLAGLVAASCFLPSVEFDPNAGTGAGGKGGSAGAGQSGSGGTAGKGGGAGTGGGTAAEGGAGGDLSTEIEEHCGIYCDRYFMACTGHPANTYDDKSDCFVTCATSGWPLRDPDMLNAPDTIECREAHALLANTQGSDPHCFHSAEVTSGPCAQ